MFWVYITFICLLHLERWSSSESLKVSILRFRLKYGDVRIMIPFLCGSPSCTIPNRQHAPKGAIILTTVPMSACRVPVSISSSECWCAAGTWGKGVLVSSRDQSASFEVTFVERAL